MKKMILSVLIVVAAVLMLSSFSMAMGPRFVGMTKITCDTYTGGPISGMYVYWRPAGQTGWLDSNRAAAGRVDQTPFDLAPVISVAGDYEVCLTAYDAVGNESGPSNVVPFPFVVPGSPGGSRMVR